jgi:hypothetical protein
MFGSSIAKCRHGPDYRHGKVKPSTDLGAFFRALVHAKPGTRRVWSAC